MGRDYLERALHDTHFIRIQQLEHRLVEFYLHETGCGLVLVDEFLGDV